MDPVVQEEIDEWRSLEPDKPSRSKAIRRLIRFGLSAAGEEVVEEIDRWRRYEDPKALPQASSAFRSIRCENIPNIAPHIAAYIRRMGIVCLRFTFGASTLTWTSQFHSTSLIGQRKCV